MRKVCILSSQRSGSTWIVDSIQKSSDKAGVHGELFLDRERKVKDPWVEAWGNLVPPVRFYDWRKDCNCSWLKAPQYYLSFCELYHRHIDTFCFKLMHDQLLRLPQLLFVLKKKEYVFIYLTRRNILEVYISSILMEKGKMSHSRENENKSQQSELLKINPQKCYNFLRKKIIKEQVVRYFLRLAKCEAEEVFYEDLIINNPETVATLNSCFGFDVILRHQDGLKKLAKKPINQRIENYDEVLQFLKKKHVPEDYYQ